jgi:hypothetical protein
MTSPILITVIPFWRRTDAASDLPEAGIPTKAKILVIDEPFFFY